MIGLGLALALAAQGAAAAPPRLPYLIPDQRRVVAGWRVVNLRESDGGRIVRMTRRHGRHRLSYRISFWHGNAGPYAHATVEHANLTCGPDEWQRDPQSRDLWAPERDPRRRSRAVRAALAQALVECHLPRGQVASALAGFDRAFRLTFHWAELSRRSTIAEIEWISAGN